MTQKIEMEVKNYFADIGYDGYSGNFPDGRTINISLSIRVMTNPKPNTMIVTLEWE